MDKQLLSKANGYVKEYMNAGMAASKEMQGSPVGKQQRSQKELDTMMKKLQALPPAERQVRMQEIANLSGHKGNKPDGCELCGYLAQKIKG